MTLSLNYYRIIIAGICSAVLSSPALAVDVPISIFPLENYNQTVDSWLKPTDPNYNVPLTTQEYQQHRTADFYEHTFGSMSPWDKNNVNALLQQTPSIIDYEIQLIKTYDNRDKSANEIGYGENFRLHTAQWIDTIADNMNLSKFVMPLQFDPINRGILVDNVNARGLPSNDVHFYNFTLAGQGYPFDNLQMSALWVGTPVYIIGHSKDHIWSLIISPAIIAWIPTNAIAKADENFISTWQHHAKQHMASIIHTQTPILNAAHLFRFTGYVGAIFPATHMNDHDIHILIPWRDPQNVTRIDVTTLSTTQAALVPIATTPHNFATLIKTLVNRPYGWGSLYFYNDCSAETQSLYTPFGIWLPRNSSEQTTAGYMVDKTDANTDERIAYLVDNGHPLMTIVYIGGHVFLYLGNYPNPSQTTSLMAMTYQDIWGLSPPSHDSRSVIGQSVLLPLLKQYPEDPSLQSLAAKTYFKVAFLDRWPQQNMTAKKISLKSLIFPRSPLL